MVRAVRLAWRSPAPSGWRRRPEIPSLPFHLEADGFWTLNSWDRTQIPKPFATVAIAVGEPLEVPADAGDEGLEAARRDLEERLQALEARALQMIS